MDERPASSPAPRHFKRVGDGDGSHAVNGDRWQTESRKSREWEELYRDRWRHDKVVRTTHGVMAVIAFTVLVVVSRSEHAEGPPEAAPAGRELVPG